MFRFRPIRFIEIIQHNEWRLKLYTISYDDSGIDAAIFKTVKSKLGEWLLQTKNYDLPVYNVGSLIIHKWSGGYFAIIQWWIDENMMQVFVYLSDKEQAKDFKIYSDKGIISCVWELEILWFERNAWIEEVMQKGMNKKNIDNYLTKFLNKY
jgi:hypothetical protein